MSLPFKTYLVGGTPDDLLLAGFNLETAVDRSMPLGTSHAR